MDLTTYLGANALLQEAQGWLEEREAENNLMLGLCLKMARSSDEIEPAPYFATVKQNDDLLVAAIMTPPHNLIVYSDTGVRMDVFEPLMADLLAKELPVPGVLGRSDVVSAFAKAWEEVTGKSAIQGMHHRIYKLTEVHQSQLPSGSFRAATKDDLTLLAQWTLAFHHEAVPNDPLSDVQEATRRRIANKEIFVWEDAGPVSVAASSRPTTNGVSVNLVYTPPECRGRGYAAACVASLSRHLLNSGFSFCTLFADLANPVSNHVYKKIGYRPICDFAEWRFAATV
jgi:predicted GNAT family acetyltransferase